MTSPKHAKTDRENRRASRELEREAAAAAAAAEAAAAAAAAAGGLQVQTPIDESNPNSNPNPNPNANPLNPAVVNPSPMDSTGSTPLIDSLSNATGAIHLGDGSPNPPVVLMPTAPVVMLFQTPNGPKVFQWGYSPQTHMWEMPYLPEVVDTSRGTFLTHLGPIPHIQTEVVTPIVWKPRTHRWGQRNPPPLAEEEISLSKLTARGGSRAVSITPSKGQSRGFAHTQSWGAF
jgi:hypothetical protein